MSGSGKKDLRVGSTGGVRRVASAALAGLLTVTWSAMPAWADDAGHGNSKANPGLADQPGMVTGSEITPAEERAVAAGLSYLAARQSPDGAWGGGGGFGAGVAITSLSGLAMMANGNLPGRGKYGENVRKAVEYVCRNQQESGLFTASQSQGEMYSHGFATLFIGEVYGMTGDDDIKENLQKAVRLIERCQNNEGGWRDQPAPVDADISVTICQIMALRAARDAGIKVEAHVIDKAITYVRRCQNADGGFNYQAIGGAEDSGFARTAAGTASLYYAGIFQDNAVTRGLDYLARFNPGPNNVNPEENGHFFYGNYYAVQAMFLAGGKYWRDWYPGIRDVLIHQQKPDGGWEREVDPDYCTAMALIILQMPDRYLPVFNGKGPGS